jgi:preprotein translocase subunit SecD
MKLKIQLEEQDYVDASLSAATPTARYIAVTCALLVVAVLLAGIFASHGYAREALIAIGVLLGAVAGSIVEQRLTIPRRCPQRI